MSEQVCADCQKPVPTDKGRTLVDEDWKGFREARWYHEDCIGYCSTCGRSFPKSKLHLFDTEGLSALLCKECLEVPNLQRGLSLLEEDALDDAQFEDEED